MEEKYETKKALATNSAKKRKVLLGTLIPLGCLVGATAIVVPVTLTYCKDNHFNLKIDPSSFQINQIKGGVPVDITNLKDQ
ncbi:hypothetical protein FACS1894218_5270 [Bacilli bacterium]|nr:hypothetical protein FACS1894218_5270 [Bacilli bacterium]